MGIECLKSGLSTSGQCPLYNYSQVAHCNEKETIGHEPTVTICSLLSHVSSN
jgi:hypothetical protein